MFRGRVHRLRETLEGEGDKDWRRRRHGLRCGGLQSATRDASAQPTSKVNLSSVRLMDGREEMGDKGVSDLRETNRITKVRFNNSNKVIYTRNPKCLEDVKWRLLY